jgi:hypothetical protein
MSLAWISHGGYDAKTRTIEPRGSDMKGFCGFWLTMDRYRMYYLPITYWPV